jgi:hypothetical protein
MKILERQLNQLIDSFPDADAIRKRIEGRNFVGPFNSVEYTINLLLSRGVSMTDIEKLRDEYDLRNSSLNLYSMSAKNFGKWAEEFVANSSPNFKPAGANDYDLLLDERIRVEVKAARAVVKGDARPSALKALNFSSSKSFGITFQGLKPDHMDCFVFLIVWTDMIKCWVMSPQDVLKLRGFSATDYRGSGLFNSQCAITNKSVRQLIPFEVEDFSQIADKIRLITSK